MTISPWAMLITPITPKVIASPMAARRSTEPRLRPWNRLPIMTQNSSRLSIRLSAWSTAARTASSVSANAPSLFLVMRDKSSERTSGSPAEASVLADSIRRAASASLVNRIAASASTMASRAAPSVSSASAASRTGARSASRDFMTARAAARRWAGSELRKVSPPSAAAMAVRSLLLTRIFLISFLATSPSAAPLSGSLNRYRLPSFCATTTAPSSLRA